MVSRRLLRIKILKALYGHFKSGDKTISGSEKELFLSIEKTYDLYHFLMQLFVEVANFAQNRIETGKQKFRPTPEERNPNTKFVDSKIVAIMRNNEQLGKRLYQNKLSWECCPELIKKLYNSLVASQYYADYMKEGGRSFEQDRSFAVSFFTNEIEDFEDLYQLLEDQSIYWVDEIEFVLGMIIKTLSKFKEDQASYKGLLPLYKDESDVDFTKRLFRKATVNNVQYREIVDGYTKNWDVDRIAYMDILILVEAIAELIEFKDIPVNITMNEYIDIAKYYSTSNSSVFINGVLDKIVKDLTEKKVIVKEGLGLVDPLSIISEE
jgi:transcription antitermination protein NusB